MKKCVMVHPEDCHDIAFDGLTVLDMNFECPALGERIYLCATNEIVDAPNLVLCGHSYISAVCVESVSTELAHFEWSLMNIQYFVPVPCSSDAVISEQDFKEEILFDEEKDTSDTELLEDIPEFMAWYATYEAVLPK